MESTILNTSSLLNAKDLFDDYALGYDLLLSINPFYQTLLEKLDSIIASHVPTDQPLTCLDIGAGTGNFSKIVVNNCQVERLTLIEPNANMATMANLKLSGINLSIIRQKFENSKLESQYDLVICFHSLYLMKTPKLQIPKMCKLVKPGGHLIVCDIGKPINVVHWSMILFWHYWRRWGIAKTIATYKKCHQLTTSNLKICQFQNKSGWRHRCNTLESYFSPFITVIDKSVEYNGYSNLLVCKNDTNLSVA